ncbi:MAG TPA: hypothetical protein PLI09_15930 [Candidatus Hydrogenedentes bacterium]|nr:hypothetical protein [Candidatus Hydrogenedentota bacterium]
MNTRSVWILACVASLLLGVTIPAHGDGTDIDYDGLLSIMDELMEGVAALHGIPPEEVILLFQQDQDQNGLLDEDQFSMLTSIVMGAYTLSDTAHGTTQLTPSVVQAIQEGFAANKVQVETDMTLTGGLCSLLTLFGYSCNLVDLMSTSNPGVGEAMLDLFAGYFTLGEAGFMNWNGTGDDFVEKYFDNLIYVMFTSTDFQSYITQIQDNISFEPNDYYKFGGAANAQPSGITQVDYLGANGDIDGNQPESLLNGAEYSGAGGDRELWLTACHITPPLHVTDFPPRSVSMLSGESYTWTLTPAGGTEALGEGVAQVKWEKYKNDTEGTVVVKPLSPDIPYTVPYLTTGDDGYRYMATVQDGIWTRVSPGSRLSVTLDSDFRITQQPAGGFFNEGDPHTLSVKVAGGNAIPGYTWYKGAEEVPGATEADLYFEALVPSNSGLYHCEITGDTGLKAPLTLISNSVGITVFPSAEGEGETSEGEGMPSEGSPEEGTTEGLIEGQTEGVAEGVIEGEEEGLPSEGSPEEGALEGTIEGQEEGMPAEGSLGEGQLEGIEEGQAEGAFEGEAEGQIEGVMEGAEEGFMEGQTEGVGEGSMEGVLEEGQAEGLLEGEPVEGQAEGEGTAEGNPEEGPTEGILEGESVEGQEEGLNEGEGEGSLQEGEGSAEDSWHAADPNHDNQISLSELLRMIQFFNSDGFHCQAGSEDGYAPGQGDQTCAPHNSDYNPQDWSISLSELLRVIQFFNSGGYHYCPGDMTEDGYCPGVY